MSIADFINAEFRYFHAHPELSMREYNTSARIRQDLQSGGVTVLDTSLETGVIAEIGSGEEILALRADIDALPVRECTGLEYQSQVPGVMHACGHDSHAAALLGTALLLKEREQDLHGRVRLIFQPGEELPGGAREIIRAGGLEGAGAIYGIHQIANYPVGHLVIKKGATHAAVDRFRVVFHGRGTHAAHPDLGVDPIVIASAFVTAVQTLISRESSPFASNLISITALQAGTTWNVIPADAVLEGTIRTLSNTDRERLKERFAALAAAVAAAHNGRSETQWIIGIPATDNDAELTGLAREVALKRGFEVSEGQPSLGGEDFALYQERLRGAFIQIGSGPSAPNHSPGFKIDPAYLFGAAEYLAELAASYLKGETSRDE